MKTKRFCWILLLNLLVLTAGAEPYETVVLKNGSVLRVIFLFSIREKILSFCRKGNGLYSGETGEVCVGV